MNDEDLPLFFEHQADPQAAAMAAFPSRDRETFMAHWERILRDDSVIVRTIVDDEQVAGNVVSWRDGGERLVGYWIAREHWGRGLATAALTAFLQEVDERPLHARVSAGNAGSVRVLEKCGFARSGEHETDLVYRLDDPPTEGWTR